MVKVFPPFKLYKVLEVCQVLPPSKLYSSPIVVIVKEAYLSQPAGSIVKVGCIVSNLFTRT